MPLMAPAIAAAMPGFACSSGASSFAVAAADAAWFFNTPGLGWDLPRAVAALGGRARFAATVDELVQGSAGEARAGDQVLVMSNGGFGGLHEKLLSELRARASHPSRGPP